MAKIVINDGPWPVTKDALNSNFAELYEQNAIPGPSGESATITGASATALAAGATPTVTLGGTALARTFTFGIPAGAKGDKGDKGDPGDSGTGSGTNSLYIDVVAQGVVTGGSTSQTAAIQALIGSNKTLFFPRGTYIINSFLNIDGLTNLKLFGEAGTIFTTTGNKILHIVNGAKNIEVCNIKFQSISTSQTHDTEGLVAIMNYDASAICENITIHYCEFTNPNNNANAIKFICEGTNAVQRNVRIQHNKFMSNSRFAIETQDHSNDGKLRMKDFDISHNYFFDTGTNQNSPVAVACVSLSGYSESFRVTDNTFEEMRMNTTTHVYYGIENAGSLGLVIANNQFISKTYGFTGILASGPDESGITAGRPRKKGMLVTNNTFILQGNNPDMHKIRGMEISNLRNSIISNNYIESKSYSALFINAQDCKFHDNICVNEENVLYFKDNANNNEFYNNLFNNSRGNNDVVVQFVGTDVTDNKYWKNKVIVQNGSAGTYIENNGATENISLDVVSTPTDPEEPTTPGLTVDDLAYVNVKSLGILPNATNQATAIRTAIGTGNKTLFFPRGTYIVNHFEIGGLPNVKLYGEPGTIFTTTGDKIISISGSSTNIVIDNIEFVSTRANTVNNTEGLLFISAYGATDTMNNVKVTNCSFTNAGTKCNAIKIVSEGTTSLIRNLYILNNKFVNIGKSGIEYQNGIAGNVIRLRDFFIENNQFHNIGTIHSGTSVGAIMLLGPGASGVVTGNTITDVHNLAAWDVLNVGISNLGIQGLVTTNNIFKSVTYGFGAFMGRGDKPIDGWILAENTANIFGTEALKYRFLELYNATKVSVLNNFCQNDAYFAFVSNCIKCNFSGNESYTTSGNTIYVRDGSTKNKFYFNTFDSSASDEDNENLIFNGATTTNNYVLGNILVRKGGGYGGIRQDNGATSNKSPDNNPANAVAD